MAGGASEPERGVMRLDIMDVRLNLKSVEMVNLRNVMK